MDYVDSSGKITKAIMISFEYLSPEGGTVESVILTDRMCRRFTQRPDLIELENFISDIIVLDPHYIVSNIKVVAT